MNQVITMIMPTRIGREPTKKEYETLNALLRKGIELEPIGEPVPIGVSSMRLRKTSKIEEIRRKNFNILVDQSREKFFGLVASVLCGWGKEISRVALYKVLFYCDFAHYKKHNVPITGMPYMHLQNGPVPAGNDSYDLFDKDMRSVRILKSRESDEDGKDDYVAVFFTAGRKAKDYCSVISDEEQCTVNSVLRQLRGKTTRELRNMTHEEKAYTETQEFDIIDYSLAASLSLTA